MTTEEVFAKIKDILVDQLSIDEEDITLESNFIDDLNADSLDIVELVMAMETEFDISIPDEEAENIKTVNDAVEYVKSAS